MDIHDQVFGKMSYDYQWEKTETLSLWGRELLVHVVAQSADDNEVEISDVQRMAYKEFKASFPGIADRGLKELVKYCKDILKVPDCNEKRFWENSQPTTIFFSITGEWGILFESKYSPEDGIALMRSGNSWEVGPQEILI